MKKIYSIIATILAVCTFVACDSPNYNTQGDKENGTLSLSKLTVELTNPDGTEVDTRAAAPDVKTFKVRIFNSKGYDQTFVYGEMPEVLTMPTGTYSVEAYNSELQEAAFEAPYYYSGAQDFTIRANAVTEVTKLVCSLKNVKVSVRYTADLAKLLGNDVTVAVTVGESNTLTYTKDETRAGYFKFYSDYKTLVAVFNGTVDGELVHNYQVLSDVEPGQHRVITFSVKPAPTPGDEAGYIGTSGIALDATVSTEDVNVNVTDEETILDPFEDLILSPGSASVGASVGSTSVTVTAEGAWTAKSDAAWLIPAVTSGNAGTSSVTIDYMTNSAPTERTGHVVFTATVGSASVSKTFTVVQAAAGTPETKGPEITPTNPAVKLGTPNQIADLRELEEVALNIDVEEGIKDFTVKITSTSEDFAAAINDFFPGGEFNLCYPATDQIRENLAALNLPCGDQVINKTAVKFDITAFMGLLVFPGTHTFTLKVTDNKDNANEKSLIIVVP